MKISIEKDRVIESGNGDISFGSRVLDDGRICFYVSKLSKSYEIGCDLLGTEEVDNDILFMITFTKLKSIHTFVKIAANLLLLFGEVIATQKFMMDVDKEKK